LYVLFAAILGLVGFFVYRSWAEKQAQNKPKQQRQELAAKRAEKVFTEADRNDWLEGTSAAKDMRRRK
jgi:hypothetical protein